LVVLAIGSPALAQEHHASPLHSLDVSLGLLTAVGGSSERDDIAATLFAGAHDAKQRGFTLRQAELSLSGQIEDGCEAKAFLVASIAPGDGETVVELEEAYVQTLPHRSGLQLRAGTFFTPFGVRNALHPHALDWMNQPIVASRMFGGDGMRGPGAYVSWSTKVPARGSLGLTVQNAHGETMPSFLANDEVYDERAIGGRQRELAEVRSFGDVMLALRATTTWHPVAAAPLQLGASFARGPNPTGEHADTWLWGLDFAWQEARIDEPDCCTFAAWSLQGEWIAREFDAAAQVDAREPGTLVAVPATTLRDHGLVVEALFAVGDRWGTGVRGEWASGSGASHFGSGVFGRADDPWRCDRLRISPLLVYRPSHAFSVRLQYDFDDSDALADAAHSAWLGCEVVLGHHAAHVHPGR
jgi:hypothetical protein